MRVRSIFSFFLLIALFALGSASAKDPAGSSNDYLALGDSVPFLVASGHTIHSFGSGKIVQDL